MNGAVDEPAATPTPGAGACGGTGLAGGGAGEAARRSVEEIAVPLAVGEALAATVSRANRPAAWGLAAGPVPTCSPRRTLEDAGLRLEDRGAFADGVTSVGPVALLGEIAIAAGGAEEETGGAEEETGRAGDETGGVALDLVMARSVAGCRGAGAGALAAGRVAVAGVCRLCGCVFAVGTVPCVLA
jgi:hypothetical protein